jgi:hypothetical protein
VSWPSTAGRLAHLILQRPKTSSAHSADVFQLLPQVPLKAGPTGSAQTFDVHAPILRITSDSTTVSKYCHGGGPRPKRLSAPVHYKIRQMHDIANAAKQVEREISASPFEGGI